MRPPITDDEIALLMQDLEKLRESFLSGDEAYHALRILEMRRQTAKLEFIKKALQEK